MNCYRQRKSARTDFWCSGTRVRIERRRPRHPHPEASQGGVREAAMRYGNHGHRRIGPLASGALAGSHPLDPVPQTVGGSLQLGGYEPNHGTICRPIAGLRHSYPRGSKVRQDRTHGEMGTRAAITSQSSVYRFFAVIGSVTGYHASKCACCTISTRTFLVSAGLLTSRKNAMRAPRTPSCVFTRI